ncbi:hypothetical protein Ahy_A10g049946 [Arachis hypogaea]|uniref:Aminotransferase-like plant mobile domain-containing protein n=1 Tax=Arachis hypogaea TaxID=3818 RepID=A0A445B897_ARAHY|nr:hypothetical protein Ahy_A10g049946 [Arachis hypogaea]
MPLHDRIIPYLETAGLYHLARLNSQWFWVDEPLDVAYQLGLPIDGEPVNGCLTEFENLMEHGRPAWERFRVLPADTTDETVRIYARAYILTLLSSQLFADKIQTRSTFVGCLIWHHWTTWADIAGVRLHWPGCIDVFVVGRTETLLTWSGRYSFYSLGFSGGFPR